MTDSDHTPSPKPELDIIYNEKGEPIDAHFSVEFTDDETSVVIAARGGTAGAPNAINLDYIPGIDLLFKRLAGHGCLLKDAVVDTRETRNQGLSRTERHLEGSTPYPVKLASVDDLAGLRAELCAAQASIGRISGARGPGNSTKRMRLYVSGLPADVREATSILARAPIDSPSDEELSPISGSQTRVRRPSDLASYKTQYSYAVSGLHRAVQVEHVEYQNRLSDHLKERRVEVELERDYIDVRFWCEDRLFIGEIKVTSYMTVVEAFRAALGQLLVYGYTAVHEEHCLVMFLDASPPPLLLKLADDLRIAVVIEVNESYTLANKTEADALHSIFP